MGQSRSQTQSTGRRGTRHAVMRRPPEGRLPRMQHSLRRWWRNLLEQSPLWIVLFVLISTWCLLPDRIFFEERVEPGTIAARTYIADQDLSVPNEEATRELQEQAREKVLPVYDFDRSIEADRRRQLAVLFETGRLALAPPPESSEDSPEADGRPAVGPEPAASPALGAEDEDGSPGADLFARLGEASTFKIDESQVELLAAKEFSPEIEDRLTSILSRVLHQGVVSDKDLLLENRVLGITVQELPSGFRKSQLDLYDYLDYPEQVRRVVELDLLSWSGVRKKERAVFAEVVLANVAPNLTFNSSATLDLKNGAAAGVGTVSRTFRQGEVIARKGAKIDAGTARAIEQMAGTRDFRRLLLTGLGTFLMAAATTLLVWLMCGQGERRDRSRERMVSESLILLVLHLLGARLAYFIAEAIGNAIQREPFSSIESYVFAIPLASLALLAVLLYGRDAALVLSLVFALLVGHIVGTDAIWMMMVYALASSLAAVFALDHRQFKQRSAMTRAGAVVGLVNVAALLTLKAMSGEVTGGLQQLGFDLVCGFLGGLLAAAVASFAVPIFEGLFQITTSIKLIELANPNLPILRRLAFEAPGTFQHSLAVANLAKSGCEAIDGDSVLVNTGALYHDIGKIFRPRYFIENQNQVPGGNPHDKVQPSMSALIIINHVKEGLELAHHHHLPQPIFDAIEQHHGTHLIKFFYNKARERSAPDTGEGREEEFRYPGPKPQSKEMGVLMLADAVEAASRTLLDTTRQKIRSLLRAIFDNCLRDGQLDQTDLTLGDLRQVEDAFLRVLTNIYHRRIDYPGFDFNKAEGGRQDTKERPEPSGGVRKEVAAGRRADSCDEVEESAARAQTRPAVAAGERRKAS